MTEHPALEALGPLIDALGDNFLAQQRDMVTVAQLQDQVIQLLVADTGPDIDVGRVKMTVFTLIRLLATTQHRVFRLSGDRLWVLSEPQAQRQILIEDAIDDFDDDVEARLRRHSGRSAEPAPQSQTAPVAGRPPRRRPRRNVTRTSPAPAPAPVPVPKSGPGENRNMPAGPGSQQSSDPALDAFFDGFHEEILRARLGRTE